MQKTQSFKSRFLKNSYLLVTAAWLITLSFIVDNYWSGNSSPQALQKLMSNYVRLQENEIDDITKDTTLINRLANKRYSEISLQRITEKKYFLFIFNKKDSANYQPLFWSTQLVDPTTNVASMQGGSGFIQLPNGFYVWRKNIVNGFTTVALIPIKWNYAITNEYLENTFAIGDHLASNFTISLLPNTNSIFSKDGNFLFSLIQSVVITIPHDTLPASIFRLLSILVLFLLVHIMATYVVHRSFYKGVTFLASFILVVRIASYYLPIPLNLRQFELFDPAIYGSNMVLRSLGDLLINAVLFLWLLLFVRHYIQEKNIVISIKKPL